MQSLLNKLGTRGTGTTPRAQQRKASSGECASGGNHDNIETLFHLLEVEREEEVIDILKKAPPETTLALINAVGPLQQTLLHIAADKGFAHLAEHLIRFPELKIDQHDKQGWTPLHAAATSKHLRICEMLIQKGFSLNAVNRDNTTPFHYLVRVPSSDELLALLHTAVAQGADVELATKYGETAVQLAAVKLCPEVIKFLAANGAQVNRANNFGETALHKACRFAGPEAIATIRALLECGADPNFAGANGTPLEVAHPAIKDELKELLASLTPATPPPLVRTNTQTRLQHYATRRKVGDSTERLGQMVQHLERKRTSSKLLAQRLKHEGSPAPSSDNSEVSEPIPRTLSDPIAKVDSSEAIPSHHSSLESVPSGSPSSSPPPNAHRRKSLALLGPLTQNLISPANGYRVELGRAQSTPAPALTSTSPPALHAAPENEMTINVAPDYYQEFFYDAKADCFHKHHNFVGYFDHAFTQPVIISVKEAPDGLNDSHRALLRTGEDNTQIFLSPKNPGKKLSAKEALHLIKQDSFPDSQIWPVDDTELRDELIEFEANDPFKTQCLPVGVIYVKDGQTTAMQYWNNVDPSEEFEEFLRVLGDRIQLQGWSGYAAGLDVVDNKKGTHSVYTAYHNFELMFHVSTLLPFVAHDEHKLARSRVIGNDVVNILFVEGNTPYSPTTLLGGVSHVWIIVRPELSEDSSQTLYRWAVVTKDFVKPFQPPVYDRAYTREEFRDFVLTKVVNGHFASMKSPGLLKMYSRPRLYLQFLLRCFVLLFDCPRALLEELAFDYVPAIKKAKEKALSAKK